jgi:hypothetical protein
MLTGHCHVVLPEAIVIATAGGIAQEMDGFLLQFRFFLVFLILSLPKKQVHFIQKSQKFQKTRDKTSHPKGASVDEGVPH